MRKHKEVTSWFLIVIVLALLSAAAFALAFPSLQSRVSLRLGDGIFKAQIADTPQSREKGYSGTSKIGQTDALLFVFDTDDKWKIWMKDMQVPIDIVWLSKDKKVVYIVKNAQPDSPPYKEYVPLEPARYVVELAAGTVDARAITIGKDATFDLNQKEGIF